MRAKKLCFKCGKETPIIGLGARSAQALIWERYDKAVWLALRWPMLFTEIDNLDPLIVESLEPQYPFFQKAYVKYAKRKF
jgi:hypothetical protein